MNQLTIGSILKLISELQEQGMTLNEIAELKIYIGDDDELNGIHTAWYVQPVDTKNEEDADFVGLINEDAHNIGIKGKAILIS